MLTKLRLHWVCIVCWCIWHRSLYRNLYCQKPELYTLKNLTSIINRNYVVDLSLQMYRDPWQVYLNTTQITTGFHQRPTDTIQDYAQSLLHPLHRLHKVNTSLSPACWRCDHNMGDFFHMFWTCPVIATYWKSVVDIIGSVTQVPLTPFSSHLLVGTGRWPLTYCGWENFNWTALC